MIKIRYEIFETNSSSTHSLCVAQNDEIEKLKNGELLVGIGWRRDKKYLITYKEAMEKLMEHIDKYGNDEEDLEIVASGDKEEIYRLMYEYEIAEPFDNYLQTEYLEPYEEEFITKNGDRVLVFGRYGYN